MAVEISFENLKEIRPWESEVVLPGDVRLRRACSAAEVCGDGIDTQTRTSRSPFARCASFEVARFLSSIPEGWQKIAGG
jgi:hypothetical protein